MRVVEAGKPNAEINVTPLVDVMLVLLIIFMVVTPMLQSGPAVKLPVTEAPPQKPEDKTQILIAVTANEMYYIGKDDKTPLNEDALKARVSEEFQRNSNAPVVVKGDARLPYGAVKKAMQIVKDAGFEQVGLITEKRQGG
jgi:TolR protein